MKNPISPKVTAGALAAAAVTILAWLLASLGVEMPAEVQGALTTVLVAVVAYLVPDQLRNALLAAEESADVDQLEDVETGE